MQREHERQHTGSDHHPCISMADQTTQQLGAQRPGEMKTEYHKLPPTFDATMTPATRSLTHQWRLFAEPQSKKRWVSGE